MLYRKNKDRVYCLQIIIDESIVYYLDKTLLKKLNCYSLSCMIETLKYYLNAIKLFKSSKQFFWHHGMDCSVWI